MLEVIDIYKSFDGQEILNNISFKIGKGGFLTILGPSGCGKSTLVRIIAGFETPDYGRIILDGKDITNCSPESREVNTVFQNYALFPHMSVEQNIAFGPSLRGNLSKGELNKKIDEVLEIVKLPWIRNRKISQLSGGQQQRVALARAIINEPKLLLLDEPLSALDAKLRESMQNELKNIQSVTGITFVVITHDQSEALSISKHIAVMSSGILQQMGTPREIYESPVNLEVANFVGDANQLLGRVIQKKGNIYTVVVKNVEVDIKSKKNFGINDEVIVLLRPEDMRVYTKSELKSDANLKGSDLDKSLYLKGRIVSKNYKGATLDSLIKIEECGTMVRASEFFDEDFEDFDYKIGEIVYVSWVNGWEQLFLKNE